MSPHDPALHVLPAPDADGPPPIVLVSHAVVRHGATTVLDHVDLFIGPREIVTVIGPNGAGKTTLIRLILGLDRPTEGEIRLAAGTVVGYVPQRLVIDPVLPITVKRLLSLTAGRRSPQIPDVLAEVGAGLLIDRSIHGLSGGEMQRVLLARALLRDPNLLVLDEPTQNVDLPGQAELYDLIGRIRDRRGCAILLVSHDLHVVMARTDRVLCLNRHVCCSGTPEDVSRHPEYQALFGHVGASSLAIYTHSHHDHRHDLAGEVLEEPRTW